MGDCKMNNKCATSDVAIAPGCMQSDTCKNKADATEDHELRASLQPTESHYMVWELKLVQELTVTRRRHTKAHAHMKLNLLKKLEQGTASQ